MARKTASLVEIVVDIDRFIAMKLDSDFRLFLERLVVPPFNVQLRLSVDLAEEIKCARNSRSQER